VTDFYDEWLRNELWTFEEAAMLFNGWDPEHAKNISSSIMIQVGWKTGKNQS
jgi:hypothetical protein